VGWLMQIAMMVVKHRKTTLRERNDQTIRNNEFQQSIRSCMRVDGCPRTRCMKVKGYFRSQKVLVVRMKDQYIVAMHK
jgi:hypothetical protein